jgi:hypothetical protein
MDRKRTMHGVAGLLESESVRRVWREEGYRYSAVDVVAQLSEAEEPGGYWEELKR